jgi:hypothetical protein
MKRESYQQFAIVSADSAQLLTEKLNATLKELRHKDPAVTFEGLTARVSYTEREEAPEDLQEVFELEGAGFFCGMCPFFKAMTKKDGTADSRNKHGLCPMSKFGKTRADSRACERLYQMIMSGEVKLCLAES